MFAGVTQFSHRRRELCGATGSRLASPGQPGQATAWGRQAIGPASAKMSFVRGVLDRLVLVCAVVAGGLVPGFIAQYRQRLGGRLEKARLDLAPWLRLAELNFLGGIGRLIRYHLESIIQSLVDTVQQLASAVAALQGSVFHQATYLALHADPGVARATWQDWVPTFALSAEGIVFALLFALLVWLAFHILWRLFALLGASRKRVHRAPRAPLSRG